jgi:hypothetical protein
VGELVQELDASQPTISKHLKVLREADLVSMRAQGQKRYYALNPKPLADVASWLETFDVGRPASAAQSPSEVPPASELATASAIGASATASAAGASATPPSGAGLVAAGAESPEASGRSLKGELSPAVAIPVGVATDDTVPQQIGRTVGRAAAKASDLLSNLPKFGRKK